jgi:hypothetical protein
VDDETRSESSSPIGTDDSCVTYERIWLSNSVPLLLTRFQGQQEAKVDDNEEHIVYTDWDIEQCRQYLPQIRVC